jgi:hypothetical protein
VSSYFREEPSTNAPLAERIQAILATKRLTLYRVSRESAAWYGRSSPYFLPHNLYYDLRTGSFRPSIHQLVALSRISGYRVRDWIRVFGFNLEDIARLQVRLPSKRTIVLDTSLTDPDEWVPWLRNRLNGNAVPSIAPLTQFLEVTLPRRLGSLSELSEGHFLYAKIGREDAFAFPDLIPGSVVRVNPDIRADLLLRENFPVSNRVFLIESSKGFCCCRLRVVGNGVVMPVGNMLSFGEVELRCPQEARLWGTVDLEFRPLLVGEEPDVPDDLARHWRPQPLTAEEGFGQVLKRTRAKLNLSLREAAATSRTITKILQDDRYAISPSSFCDYELRDTLPRDFHKIITLCSLYGLQFQSLLKRLGIAIDDAGTQSIPDRYLSRPAPIAVGESVADDETIATGFLGQLLQEFQEIPFPLRNSLGWFFSSGHVSLDDFFWIGGESDPLHPYLEKGLLVLVNRRRKTPFHFVSKPVWQQPVYLILKRDGTYLAACCGAEDGTLVVHPYAQKFYRATQFRDHQDAEVVGQIVAIVRKV